MYIDRHARAILTTLTPHEKRGQQLVPIVFPVGPHDPHVTAELRALLAECVIGGSFIMFASGDAGQVAAFIGELKAAVPLVMTAHMQVPALDRDLPTSLSPAVIQGVLWRGLGYDGLVISDSLAMGALARFLIPHAALQAGTDLLLGMPDIGITWATLEALRAALAAGALSAVRQDTSVLRILRFKLDWLGAELARDTASVGGEDVA